MEKCYDGALVMPSSYAVMNEEEMTYVEGGGKITINRTTINNAFKKAFGYASVIGFLANKGAAQIAATIGKSALAIGKALLSLGGVASFIINRMLLRKYLYGY